MERYEAWGYFVMAYDNDALTMIRLCAENNKLRAAHLMLDLAKVGSHFTTERGAPTYEEARALMREVWALLKECGHIERIPPRIEVGANGPETAKTFGNGRNERG